MSKIGGEMKKFIVFSLICILLGWVGYDLYKYTLRHPITIKHPCPTLTKYVPALDMLDDWLHLTAGIMWYKVRAHRTGQEYFVRFSYGDREYIHVMHAERKDRWIELNRRQYNYLFEKPAYGNGYAFPYDLKED